MRTYHVDYWNRLGWKDVFSKSEWSARQQYYAAMLDFEGVYTPQIVVNGKQEFVGSNESKLRNAISNAGKEHSALLTMSATKIFVLPGSPLLSLLSRQGTLTCEQHHSI